MSTWPGGKLEDYLMFWYDLIVEENNGANQSLRIIEALGVKTQRITLTEEQFKPIVSLFEPYREQVEIRLNWFNEETQSWRDYCGFPMDDIQEDVCNAADAIVKGYRSGKHLRDEPGPHKGS